MSAIVTRCRQCGQEFEPERSAIMAGPAVWQRCPACRPTPPQETRCEQCGRTLRAGKRTLCLSCMTGGTGL